MIERYIALKIEIEIFTMGNGTLLLTKASFQRYELPTASVLVVYSFFFVYRSSFIFIYLFLKLYVF